MTRSSVVTLGEHIERSPGPFRTLLKPAGERLVHRGDPPPRVFYLSSGLVMLSVGSAAGDEQTCSLRGENSLIGYEGLIAAPASFDGRILVQARLQVAEVADFRSWLQEHPEAKDAVVRCLAEEAAKLAVERHFVLGTSTHRLIRFLMARETSPLMSSWHRAPLHAVAGLLSIRPETLSRSLRTLQKEKLVDESREIKVLDLEGLARLIGEGE